jgi:hypothetical protein
MKFIIFLCFSLFVFTANATASIDTCVDPDVYQQWQNALKQYPEDHMLLKLASLRRDLCDMVENNEMDVNTALFIWQQALTTALLERAHEDHARRGLLRLFGTF